MVPNMTVLKVENCITDCLTIGDDDVDSGNCACGRIGIDFSQTTTSDLSGYESLSTSQKESSNFTDLGRFLGVLGFVTFLKAPIEWLGLIRQIPPFAFVSFPVR